MNRINDWDKQILTAQDIARIFKCGKNLAYKIIENISKTNRLGIIIQNQSQIIK